MVTICTENELLQKTEEALNYENSELGLKAGYWVGNNNCIDMDTTKRPNFILCQY